MSPYVPTALIRAQSDERLARLAALGSERAFEAIVERYRQPLLAYARRLVGDSRAEDVVQASFVAAWTDLRRGTEIREVRAWLYRVVHNRSLNVLKRADNGDVPLLDIVHAAGPGVAAEVEDRDAIRSTLKEIADLPERQRVALLAVAVDGRRHRDVGVELGLSEGAVKMLVNRARGTLRAAAGAFTPWPLLARLAGVGGGGAGSSAGAGVIGAGALKAGAVLATAGALATATPPALHAIEGAVRPATAAAPPSTTGAAAHALAATGDPLRLVRMRTAAPQAASEPAATAEPPGPGPGDAAPSAATPAPAAAAPAPGVEHADTVSTAPARDFLTPASKEPVDDDLIEVIEDPPDAARGEQAIPLDGVPDALADAIPGDAPDPGDDPPEPAGDGAAQDSATTDVPPAAADAPAASASATPAAGASATSADVPAASRDLSAADVSQ